MLIQPIDYALLVWFILAALSTAYVAWELDSMVHTLEHLARHCHGDHRPECAILDDLSK